MKKKEFYVGDKAYMFVKYNMYAEVEVVEKRVPYGRALYKVKPVAGIGECVVLASSLFTPKEIKND